MALREGMENFGGGAVFALPTTKLPAEAFPVGFNTALSPLFSGGITKRPGFVYKNTLDSAAGSWAAGQAFFVHDDDGSVATHHIAVSNTGYIYDISGTTTNIPLPTTHGEFPDATLAGTTWRFAMANNALFGTSGQQAFKLYKKTGINTVYAAPVGIAPPDAAPTQGTLAAGAMTGDYDFLVTWYNEYTGIESARSAILSLSLTAQNAVLNLSGISAPAAEVTKIRVYVRKQSIDPGFFRDASMEYAYNTTSVTLDLDDTEITNLFLEAPAVNENAVMPDGIVDMKWHLSRMFAATANEIYYSKVARPEQFNLENLEYVNPLDGQKIVALHPVNESTLLVLKERSAYLFVGAVPDSWEVRLLTSSHGCTSKMSVVEGDGYITWWSQNGPVLWDKSGPPQLIADATIIPLHREGQLYLNTSDATRVVHDPINHRFLYSLNLVSGSDFDDGRWTVAPYSLNLKVWEALAWDLGTIYSFVTGPSSSGEYRVFFGGPNKYVFELTDTAKTDAAQNTTGADLYHTITVSSTSAVSFVSTNAVPISAYNAYAKIIDATTMTVTRVTGTISSVGTTRTLTFGSSLSSAPALGSIIVFDLPVMELETRAFIGDALFDQKRYLFTYLRYASNGDTPAKFGIRINNAQPPTRVWSPILTASGTESYGSTPASVSGSENQFSGRVAKVGEEAQLLFIGYYPLTTWYLTALALGYTIHYAR